MEIETLKQLMKESIREVIREERLSLMQVLIPDVSDQEMKEIIKKLGLPEQYDEQDFVDMTTWVNNESQI